MARPINIYIESDNVNVDSENDESEQLRGINNTFILYFNLT
jgi:hypothetical protein